MSTTRTLPRCDDAADCLEAAGCGALESAAGNLPLRKLDVRCRVDGLACQTRVTQVFRNSHAEFVEATYIFPLPGRFAVTACTMRVQDRVIEAELKERSQARTDYDRAIRAGHRASIAEEERSETFNLRVGNIPPGEEVTVELTLAGMLPVVAGEATLRVPLVVAPRYVSGAPLAGPSVGAGTEVDTDEVPDASRVTPPTLLPGFPNPVALSVEVELNLGAFAGRSEWRDAIRSSLHSVLVSDASAADTSATNAERCTVRLLPGERVNRDFILRFPILPATAHSALEYSHPADQPAGVFAVTILPPARPTQAARPRDVVFVLDRSGSMEGWKMVAARRAVGRMIDSLGELDRFRLLAFDDRVESAQKDVHEWQPATDRRRWRAAEWIAKIDARGGTELGHALQTALRPFAFGMPETRDAVVVVITDGQVAGEDSVLRSIHDLRLARLPRIFTLGIDRAVNASMLTRLAEMGGGSFEMVESEERLDQVMERFHREIGSPVLRDLRIEPVDCDLIAASVTPARTPDVFADRPVTIRGRIVGRRESIRLRVTARDASGAAWQQEVTVARGDSAALLPLWGRSRIRDLEDRYASGEQATSAAQAEIVAVSLESHVLSRFTAYVAVDHAEVVNPSGVQHQIMQPVAEPEGWVLGQTYAAAPMAKASLKKLSQSATRGLSSVRRSRSLPDDEDLSLPPEPMCSPSMGGSEENDDTTILFSAVFGGSTLDDSALSAAEILPESVARESTVSPVSEQEGKLLARMSDPNDQETMDSPYSGGSDEAGMVMSQKFSDSIDFTERIAGLQVGESPTGPALIERLVHLIVNEALQRGASHVYLLPNDVEVRTLFLVQGAAVERDPLPQRLLDSIISRFRVLAKLDAGADRLQAGEIRVTIGDRSLVIRAYLIPTLHGPSVVLRLPEGPLPVGALPEIVAAWLADARAASLGDPEGAVIYARLLADSNP